MTGVNIKPTVVFAIIFVKTTDIITITTHMKIVPLPANTGLSIARIDCATPVSDVIIIVESANNAPDKIIVSHTTPCFPALGISIISSPSTFVIHIAYLTPAASPFASLLFGFSDWVHAKDIYKYGSLACIGIVIVFLVLGIPLSNIFF